MALKKLKKIVDVRGAIGVWKTVLDLILAEPKILLPFAALAAVETVALWFLSCSPHFPVSIVMAPPIKRIWGEIYLHYPYIYELLPRIFYYAKIVAGIFAGSVTSAAAVLMVARLKAKRPVDIKEIFLEVLKRYVTLMILAAILFIAVHYAMKQPQILLIKYFRVHAKFLFIGPKFWFTVFLPVAAFLLAVVLQGLMVYSIPYVILKGRKFASALLLGVRLFFKKMAKTLVVISVPMLLYIPITIVRSNMGIIVEKFSPEASVIVLFAGILVGTVIVDGFVTIAATLLFLEANDEK